MSSRTKALIIGSVVGAVLGAAAAWLFIRRVEEEAQAEEAARTIGLGQVVRLGASILGVLRQIVDLGRQE